LKLGSGVVNLPMHHPFHVADRMVMLDHVTHGRAMLGVGSGARWADFRMLGHDPTHKAQMSADAIAAIVALMRGDEPVTMKTDWFELREARLQLASYQQPHLPIAVAGSSSIDEIPAAGRHGLWQITPAPSGTFLRNFWERVERGAAQYGQQVCRQNFRAMKFVHLAESREEALNEVREGLRHHRHTGRHDRAPERVARRFGWVRWLSSFAQRPGHAGKDHEESGALGEVGGPAFPGPV
jgi:limonene 1,2-monooxygenase